MAVKLTVRTVTAVAYATAAPIRPATYGRRWPDTQVNEPQLSSVRLNWHGIVLVVCGSIFSVMGVVAAVLTLTGTLHWSNAETGNPMFWLPLLMCPVWSAAFGFLALKSNLAVRRSPDRLEALFLTGWWSAPLEGVLSVEEDKSTSPASINVRHSAGCTRIFPAPPHWRVWAGGAHSRPDGQPANLL